MSISVLDLFKIGIGPSSSHTVGPMVAAHRFVNELADSANIGRVSRVKVDVYGSLAATGPGHGTPKAVLLGLEGELPDTVEIESASERAKAIREGDSIKLASQHTISFDYQTDFNLLARESLPFHPNGIRFFAFDDAQNEILVKTYYSIGGGFIKDDGEDEVILEAPELKLAYPFTTADALLKLCNKHQLSISCIMKANEQAWREEAETKQALLAIWDVMQECVRAGLKNEGHLPGGLKVNRRAKHLHQKLLDQPEQALTDPLVILDWVSLYALAVNEENAGGGRVVTAPTNGAAGIIPAVMHYYVRFVPGANQEGVINFLLTAAAIGILYKENASISGAEVGCQGEVGSACSMAAGALAEALGGTPEQVENAAEIAMEHNLGLTCDPIGGLVQVPCIERNAMASVKAIHAARMALRGDGSHFVSLDKVIRTMRDTGRDMQDKYKETARGGLAINVVEVPVNFVEC